MKLYIVVAKVVESDFDLVLIDALFLFCIGRALSSDGSTPVSYTHLTLPTKA